jgi:hypothetical protein
VQPNDGPGSSRRLLWMAVALAIPGVYLAVQHHPLILPAAGAFLLLGAFVAAYVFLRGTYGVRFEDALRLAVGSVAVLFGLGSVIDGEELQGVVLAGIGLLILTFTGIKIWGEPRGRAWRWGAGIAVAIGVVAVGILAWGSIFDPPPDRRPFHTAPFPSFSLSPPDVFVSP